ncbi:D-alanine--D-alanine ligase [Syntrophotalea acetylenivorans]|uniref:D-alanine--D-alanine ligase n=1 Tax=Syntrophotalea acetylenivorans TaxID=1842532 RepID=A0A1L3GSM4_9BACT|nr:D-alanine--D-alanine ligase [Syntrophotalea acetylenivorans]APG28880.1 D-alanine--D-alanine ligase [Syntrophotalea acetylenivorans]
MIGDTPREKPIAVLMGGLSAERDVSLRTGEAVLQSLKRLGYAAFAIDAGRDLPSRLTWQQASKVFIALHGRYGEDGTVQGLLEIMQLPYTGSGVLASSMAMDKVVTKKLLVYHNQPTPAFVECTAADLVQGPLAECPPLPVVVKPAREGSTIGISLVRKEEELQPALEEALRHDELVLVEQFIAGREVTVGVLDGEALPIIEVVPEGGFYDYQAKYTAGRTEYLLPAPLESELYANLQQAAVEVFNILGCSGAARIDFMIRDDKFFCLEANTIPGMTETSLLPKAAAAAGISFDQLVERILAGAGINK